MYVDFSSQLFNSLVGSDGWCIHFDKSTRKCSIYAGETCFLSCLGLEISLFIFWWFCFFAFVISVNSWTVVLFLLFALDRPYFCRVEPAIFETLYGIEKKKFNKEACRYNWLVFCSCTSALPSDFVRFWSLRLWNYIRHWCFDLKNDSIVAVA